MTSVLVEAVGIARPEQAEGFIQSLPRGTRVLEPEVPWDNIVAFVEAVEEYGKL